MNLFNQKRSCYYINFYLAAPGYEYEARLPVKSVKNQGSESKQSYGQNQAQESKQNYENERSKTYNQARGKLKVVREFGVFDG